MYDVPKLILLLINQRGIRLEQRGNEISRFPVNSNPTVVITVDGISLRIYGGCIRIAELALQFVVFVISYILLTLPHPLLCLSAT